MSTSSELASATAAPTVFEVAPPPPPHFGVHHESVHNATFAVDARMEVDASVTNVAVDARQQAYVHVGASPAEVAAVAQQASQAAGAAVAAEAEGAYFARVHAARQEIAAERARHEAEVGRMREEMAELRSALKGLVEERSRAFTSPTVPAQADSPAPSYFSSPSSPGQVTGGHSVIACSICGRPISCDGPASSQRVCTLCAGKAAAPVPNFPIFSGPSSSDVGNVGRDGSTSLHPGAAAYFPAQGQQHAG